MGDPAALTLGALVIIGGLGIPVYIELLNRRLARRDRRWPARWSLRTRRAMIARFVREVKRIARRMGFLRVTIVIEKGRPRRLEAGTRDGLEPREGAPPS